MNNSALIISILALLFTVFSFWWMNWRRGKLVIGAPRSYAAKGSQDGSLQIKLPFVFFNDGASPIVVQNLRLVFLHEDSVAKPLSFIATCDKLTGEGRSFATQFPVRGREALKLICEFQRTPGNLVFEARRYQIELQAVFEERQSWQGLYTFELNVPENSLKNINSNLLVYDNQDA